MNKFKQFFLNINILVLSLCLFGFSSKGMQEFDTGKVVHTLINTQSKILCKKNNMWQIGDIVGMPNGVIHKIGASFQKETASLDEARIITVEGAQNFLNAINNDENLRPYLSKYPLTIDNIDITLFFINNKADEEDNVLKGCFICKENIVYLYKKIGEEFGYSKEIEEPFDEAIKKVQKENNHE